MFGGPRSCSFALPIPETLNLDVIALQAHGHQEKKMVVYLTASYLLPTLLRFVHWNIDSQSVHRLFIR